MKTVMPAWTYSALESFETCPRKYYHTRVARDVTESMNEQAVWGNKVHKALEERVRDGVALPEGMTQWEPIAAGLQSLPGKKLFEEKFAVSKNFSPVPWKAAWTRGVADLVVIKDSHAEVFDYKTGKRKLTHQLALYAGYVFAYFDYVQTVSTRFVWLKESRVDKESYVRTDVPKIWNGFLPKVIKLEKSYETDKWPCKPNGLCNGWCPVTSCSYYKGK
jgi:hypothetical protein